MNNKFLFSAIIAAVVANCAIIGCGRSERTSSEQGLSAKVEDNNSAKEPQATAAPAAAPAVAVADTSKPLSPGERMLKKQAAKPEKSPYEKSDIEIKTFKVDPPGSGYGYDVMIDKRPYLHQPNIPAVPGNNGFSSEENAKKAAGLVVYKIRHNIMPPTIDPKELDSLGVLK
jgi:hypothetical protein